MAINNKPIFTGTPAIGVTKFTQANANTRVQIFPTTPSTWVEGMYVQKIRLKLSSGSNTNTHVFFFSISNGTSHSVYDTLLIPPTTFSNTAPSPIYEMPLNISIPTGWYPAAQFTGTIAGTFTYDIIVFGGTYTAQ